MIAKSESESFAAQNQLIEIVADSLAPNRRGPLLVGEKGATLQKRVWTELATKFEAIQPGVLQGI